MSLHLVQLTSVNADEQEVDVHCPECGVLVEDFLIALESRSVIGQAQGILMYRYGMDAAAAWTVMRRYSNDTNIRMREIAREVIANRELPPYYTT